jgi:hypothetical protein
MNYGTLNTLNSILQNLKSDAATIGLTIASLMIVIYSILVMVTDDTNVAAHHKRWENLRKVFVCAALIAAAGAIISFGQDLGSLLH